jgi:hypothetical protein
MNITIAILAKKMNSSFIATKPKKMKEYQEIAMIPVKIMDASKKRLEYTKKCVTAFPIAKYAKIMKLVKNAERNGYYLQKRQVVINLVLIV